MKNKYLNYIVCGLITLCVIGCDFSAKSKTKTEYSIRTASQAEFVYSNGDKKVEMILELEKDAKALVLGIPIKAYFKTENINTQKFKVFGPGIMVKQGAKHEFRYTIIPTERFLVDGKLEIQVTEQIENAADFTHKFLVPVATP
ncbi:hypothetical protein MWU65_01235 [Cellulophaga sp. F20128]|uniref:hypothetical protein n=1 Tax=Cellulophaga sp. F20128 TaxID=2926413 RepID=UPI001FF3A454|nr:hypothetical protein [Cellulophaga sp. F20128]MCK0155783.1 hypothetical protein [Cellulophaga sp. F20128]